MLSQAMTNGDENSTARSWTRRAAIGSVVGVLLGLALWLVLAFALRVVVLGDGNTTQDRMTTEVERGVRASASREGEVSEVLCRKVTRNAWDCRLRFADGRGVLMHAVSYSPQNLGISVVQRYAR
jgi:hypothetical protein